MKRREFITLLGGAAAWPLAAGAQQPAMPKIGFLRSTSSAESVHLVEQFRHGLKQAGYVEGQNVTIDYVWAENQLDRLPALVAELLRRPVTMIVGNTPPALAAKAATTTVPIVFATGGDPVKEGLVANLNRPGANVTGVSFGAAQLGAKQLGLLRELGTGAAGIAVLVDPKWPLTEQQVSDVRIAASAVGQQVEVLYASNDHEIEPAFTTLVQRGMGALLVGSGGFMLSRREEIAKLAARHRIPAIYVLREYVVAGGLMSYAPSFADAYRQVGGYAGRILKGERPGDLPVMLPTKFEFVINLKTAKALGIRIPDDLLSLADEVIE
jgi:putative ABC transport system substrate-binding protein